MKLELYFIFVTAFFMFVTCTGPNARGESNRISRFVLNTSSMQEKEKMKYALEIIGLPNESDITQYSVADLGRLKNMRIMAVKRKIEQASQFLLKCLVETITDSIENAVEDQFTFDNQQFTPNSYEKTPDSSQSIVSMNAVTLNSVQTSQLAVTQLAQQGSSFSAEHQPNHFIGPSSSELLPQLMTQSFSGNNLISVQQETTPITLPSSSGNVLIPQQNTSIYTGLIPSIQLPLQAETNPGINSTLLGNGLPVQQVASMPSNVVENFVRNDTLVPQVASMSSNAVEDFAEIQHYSPQAISILLSDFADDEDAEEENFEIDEFDSAKNRVSSPSEEESNNSSSSESNLMERSQSQTIQSATKKIVFDYSAIPNQSTSDNGQLISKSGDFVPGNTNAKFVTLEFYLTKEEAKSKLIEKEFIYTLDSIGNFSVTLKLHCLITFERLAYQSLKNLIRPEFRSVKPQNLTFSRLRVNRYFEEYDEYISKRHYASRLKPLSGSFSRLKPFSSSGNNFSTASQKCNDIFIIKISLDESKTGFIRSYNLHKYGIFSIAHNGPIADNTFLVSTEFDFCALVITNGGSVVDLKKVNNPTPNNIISTPVLTDHYTNLLEYYGDITTYNNPPETDERRNLIWIPYKPEAAGFTFTSSEIEAQVDIKPHYSIKNPEEVVKYQINRIVGKQTKYSVFVDKLIRAIFYEPLKAYASQHNKEIRYGDLVFVFQRRESTSIMLITANDRTRKRKFVLTIPPLQPNFYFVKGLGITISDYLIVHIQ